MILLLTSSVMARMPWGISSSYEMTERIRITSASVKWRFSNLTEKVSEIISQILH